MEPVMTVFASNQKKPCTPTHALCSLLFITEM